MFKKIAMAAVAATAIIGFSASAEAHPRWHHHGWHYHGWNHHHRHCITKKHWHHHHWVWKKVCWGY